MSASLEMVGVLIKIFPAQRVSEKLEKREFVVETEEQYSQQIKFELMNEKCKYLDDYKEGEKIKVSFNLRGREWQGKYFVNLNAWRMEKADGNTTVNSSNNQNSSYSNNSAPVNNTTTTSTNNTAAPDDDLPF